MTINLFEDQKRNVENVRKSLRMGNKAVLLQAATGSGKTVMGAEMIIGSRMKGHVNIFMVPRRQLLKQTADSFAEKEMPFSYIAAGMPHNPFAKTYLATSGTLANWVRAGKAPAAKVLFVDETHYGAGDLDLIIKYYKSTGCIIIGLSATPCRTDGKGLGCWYDDMVCGESVGWLIDNKRLSQYRFSEPDNPDLSKIRTVAGDYAKGELASYMEHANVLVGNTVQKYMDNAMGMLGVTYTVSRKHSEIVAKQYRDAGVPAVTVDGLTEDAELRRIIRAFARREILQLVNCELLIFGFDLASSAGMDVTIEALSDLQPTKSISKQMQKWGRALRMKEFPAKIFDHAGNSKTHGYPCDDREWTLEGVISAGRGGGGGASVANVCCPKCGNVEKPTLACTQCGHKYPDNSRMVKTVDGELIEVDPRERRAIRASDHKKKLEMLIELARERGIKEPEKWAAKKITEEMVNV